jgi:hypothetical protein
MTEIMDGIERPNDFDRKCQAEVQEYLRQKDVERRAWAKANRRDIKLTQERLLAIGGKKISPQPNEYIQCLASHGQLMDCPVIFREMEPSQCHENVRELWLKKRPKSRLLAICTGYGLTEDDMWRPHSWGLSRTAGKISIIETTVIRSKYFGVMFNREGSDIFARNGFS